MWPNLQLVTFTEKILDEKLHFLSSDLVDMSSMTVEVIRTNLDFFIIFFTRRFYKHKKHKKHKNDKQANKNKKGNIFYAHKKHLRERKSLV